ncbi:MAG: hypothetical protein ACOCZQ_00195 [Nanoarchaeota archaeon]
MATPVMDAELLQHFSPFFIFIFLFAISYAILQWGKMFGETPSIHIMISLVIAFFGGIYSEPIRGLIEYIIPWFVFLIVLFMLVIMLIKMLGVSDDSIQSAGKSPGVYWTILIIVLVIIIGGLSNVFGEDMLEFTQGGNTSAVGENGEEKSTHTGDIEENIGATFFHPTVLGMIFILLMTALGAKLLSAPATKK